MKQGKIEILEGDITTQDVDAVVNAANNSLLGGGGVDGAIHRAAGRGLIEACRKLKGCATGQAKITAGYQLPAQHVIHTVGPIWRDGKNGEDELLAECYRNALRVAQEHDLKTIAFPSISTGAYGFPVDRAARIALREILKHLNDNPLPKEVRIVCFDQRTFAFYEAALNRSEAGPRS